MGKLLSWFREALAIVADTAQILGVDWKSVIQFGLALGGGAALIGFFSEVGPFGLAIGSAAAGLLASGSLALSQYRKALKAPRASPSSTSPRVKAPVEERIVALQRKKPRYAAPADAKDIDITDVTNKDLGELMEAGGNDILKFEKGIPYDATEERVISQFHKKVAPGILWAYEEAKRRGFKDSTLEHFYSDPSGLRVEQLKWLRKELITLGASIALHAD